MKTYQDSEGRVLLTQWEALHVAEDHRRQHDYMHSIRWPAFLPCGHAVGRTGGLLPLIPPVPVFDFSIGSHDDVWRRWQESRSITHAVVPYLF